MNKITVILDKSKSKKIEAFLKKSEISKFFIVKSKAGLKYEFIVTDLKTPDILEDLKLIINGEGFITINPTNLIYPNIEEKGMQNNLEELILRGAKNFIKLDKNYILFTVCAAIIACIGFQINSIIVLISAMIICPLMSPIMALSFAIASSNNNLISKSLKVELIGIALIIFVSLIVSLFPNFSIELEKSLASTNLIYSLIISFVIGIVSANSFLTGKYEHLTGAAVGISLLPPLTNTIILLTLGEFYYSISSALVFLFNLIGMHLSSTLFFIISEKKK